MTEHGRKAIVAAVVAAAVVLVCLYATIDPETGTLFPKCPFFALTGLQCPGCGSQRAIHDLLHGHPGEALRHNALLVASIPFLAVLGAAEITRKSHPKFHAAINSPKTAITVLVVVIAWWIVRNIISI